MCFKVISTPLGKLLLESDGDYLTGIKIYNEEEVLEEKSLGIFLETEYFLDSYFKGVERNTLNYKLIGSEFQKRIWNILLRIPYGEIRSYGEVTREYMKRYSVDSMSPQAVGTAIGKNPLLILVPCHRVIKSDGSIGGFSAGIKRKEFLLNLEKENILK